MNHPIAMFLVLVSFVVIFSSTTATSDSRAEDQGLHLNSYSADQVEGCYVYNQSLGVCFDIRKGFMKLLKTTGEEIVHYRKFGPKMFLYQALDHSFIWHDTSMTYVPNGVSRTPEALRASLRRINKNGMAAREVLKNHYQEAMSELHNVPEVQLLERLSATLADNSTQLEILQPFHVLCLNILKVSDIEISPELKVAHDLEEGTAEKRSCVRPTANDCRGLCGKGCSCWSWICGDCCRHQGCYEHDLCCKENPTSPHCLWPYSYGFECSKFEGYEECLSWSWWG